MPITWIVIGAAVFGVVGSLLVREPVRMLESVRRLPYAQDRVVKAVIPAGGAENTDQLYPVRVSLRGDELQTLMVESDQRVLVADAATESEMRGKPLEVDLAVSYRWSRPREGSTGLPGSRGYTQLAYLPGTYGRSRRRSRWPDHRHPPRESLSRPGTA